MCKTKLLSFMTKNISKFIITGPPIPPGSSRGLQPPPPPPPPSNLGQPPKLQPRSPKVSVPTTSPALSTPPAPSSLSPFGGAKTRFSASSPKKTSLPDLSPRFQNQVSAASYFQAIRIQNPDYELASVKNNKSCKLTFELVWLIFECI